MGSLVDKLNRARVRLLGTAATEIPTPFALRCDCGRSLTGLRQTVSQQISCPGCGETRFVLPVNIYPTTLRVRSEVLSGGLTKRLGAAARELLPRSTTFQNPESVETTGTATAVDPTVAAAESLPAGRSRRRTATAERSAAPVVPADKPPLVSLPQIDVKRVARRTITPFRVLMLSAVAIVIGTGWWSIQQTRLANARQDWRTATDAIEMAIAESRFHDLEEPLQMAVAAAEVLNKRDAEARQVLNLKDQTDAINQVSSVDLIGELERAYLKSGTLDETRVAALQNAAPPGMQFFECPVVTSSANPQRVQLSLPLIVHSHRVRIESQSSLLRDAAASLPGSSLLFTARIESCSPPRGDDGEWLIELHPDGCALLTSELHCLQLGLNPSQNPLLRQQLSRQKDYLESVDLFQLKEQDQQQRAEQLAALEEASQ